MRRSASLSIALHVVVALLVIGVFPNTVPELPEIPPAIPVELVNIGEVTNIKKIDKVDPAPKPEETPAEPEPEPMRQAATPPAPEPKPEPAPEPLPAPPEPPKPEPKPEEKKAEEKKPEPPKPDVKPAPPKPPEKKKEPAFDASKIAALLNKLPPKEKSTVPGETKKVVTGPVKTEAAGAGTEMTVSARDAIRAQMARCWSVPAGAPHPEQLIVNVRFGLNQDGSLARAPEIMDTTKLALGDNYYRAAAEGAVRALNQCAPFKLPPGVWTPDFQDIEMTFDPRLMLGG